jgi:hypothetical protein
MKCESIETDDGHGKSSYTSRSCSEATALAQSAAMHGMIPDSTTTQQHDADG